MSMSKDLDIGGEKLSLHDLYPPCGLASTKAFSWSARRRHLSHGHGTVSRNI